MEDSRLRLLSLYFFLTAMYFTAHILWFKFELMIVYPHLLKTVSPFIFLPAPIFYFGVRQMIDDQFEWKKKYIWHFLPFVFHLLELIPLYSLPLEEKRKIAELIITENIGFASYAPGLIPSIWIDLLRFFLMAAYFILAWIRIFGSGFLNGGIKKMSNENWIRYTLYCFGLFQIILLFQSFLNIKYYFTGIYYAESRALSVWFLMGGTFLYLLFLFIKIRVNFDRKEKIPDVPEISFKISSNTELNIQRKILVTESISPEDLDLLREKLDVLFEQELVFLNPDLLARDLALQVGVSPRILSEVLTSLYGKNFKDLINSFRVLFAKNKIDNKYLESYTIESLAKTSGFNSRVTFFNVFKKDYFMSPTEYWKSIND